MSRTNLLVFVGDLLEHRSSKIKPQKPARGGQTQEDELHAADRDLTGEFPLLELPARLLKGSMSSASLILTCIEGLLPGLDPVSATALGVSVVFSSSGLA